MKLSDKQGENVRNIMCGAYDHALVRTASSGELEMVSPKGGVTWFPPGEVESYAPGAPEGCPLTVWPIDRGVGNVAVCLECQFAVTNMPEERFRRYVAK